MAASKFDIIIIGSGSGGLSIGLFMAMAGFKVLMVSKSDHDIGGDCLNDGCVPSKSFIHVAKIAHSAKEAAHFGLKVEGEIDIQKVNTYIHQRQEQIRSHENAAWLKAQGISVALGEAKFVSEKAIKVNNQEYEAPKIIIATGSKPRKLFVPGIEQVAYYDNESIFSLEELPKRMLVIGGGPIGIEMAQALSRLGSEVSLVSYEPFILKHDAAFLTETLKQKLEEEGICFYMEAKITSFTGQNTAVIKQGDAEIQVNFDAIFVAIGRELVLDRLDLPKAGIKVEKGKIVANDYLQTSNKRIMVCGDVAGDLMFSHAAEFHARIIINNLLSPFRKKLDNRYLSWVTFADPELATFGLSEAQLQKKNIPYTRLQQNFKEDDRAVTDNYQYGKMQLFLSKKGLFGKQKILGGNMLAPNAGELVQELMLANSTKLTVDKIFNKIYPYPVASRVNQKLIVDDKSKIFESKFINKLLRIAYQLFS